ncbi:MAG: pyruvate, phosphate dikinase [bacterium]|nr:pyruvate, phosphate dikinase [bacterium]
MSKQVYFFGAGKADGDGKMKELLGGKGANLAEMNLLGIPVPAGITITTECCRYYSQHKKFPAGLEEAVLKELAQVEKVMEAKFGDKENPLLVSVRSGAPASMPGMMDTVLNLGLNDETVESVAHRTDDSRFAYDCYRRFIQMYSDVVMDVDSDLFEHLLTKKRQARNVKNDYELPADDLKTLVKEFKAVVQKEKGRSFPQDPKEQLWGAIAAVFRSWDNKRAIEYRRINKIPGHWGTAVNVQAMVFGNMGNDSATGVCFTRNPSTGENHFYGEYLINAQGEDVVAGIRTPQSLQGTSDSLEKKMPSIYQELVTIYQKLEKSYRDMQDIEFTIQKKKLWLLQTRNGKRTAAAAVKIAVDMVHEKMISEKEAILRVKPEQLDQLLHPMLDPKAPKKVLAKGLPASPGAAVGKIVFTADQAQLWAEKGEKVILVRIETSPEDIHGMNAAVGILTARGGMTSHAAVVARGMGKCCVAGCGDLEIHEERKELTVKGKTFHEGDTITLNGSSGEVIEGVVATVEPKLSGDFGILMSWADKHRRLKVRTNADTPKDAKVAREFGAEGIGLCRTEHMFFEPDRIEAIRKMIVAEDVEGRRKALATILPMQKGDFAGIFEAMNGFPVTVRLLDPPLHEFLPHAAEEIASLAKKIGVTVEHLQNKLNSLHEFNPMLGHRGCRLGISYPEIYEMQVRAIMEAACELTKKGIKVFPEIEIPLVGQVTELIYLREICIKVAEEAIAKTGQKVAYKIGTMIELPRAALTADEIAPYAEFFSFGTNDLTQTTYGFSRDDAGKFLQDYLDKGIMKVDPFVTIDPNGVGALMTLCVEKGRKVNPKLEVGICGEHGGDPDSVIFCDKINLDYVSCSPYRVPIARLAAAHAVLGK